MDLKEKILKLLEEKNYSYTQLAEYLGVSEQKLDYSLETETLEVRTLELISKALRIPLYSFFRDVTKFTEQMSKEEEKYYNVSIWEEENTVIKTENQRLKEELLEYKKEIEKRDLLIEALESQIKKGG